MDFWAVFGIVANVITVLAGIIAIVGVLSAVLSRPMLEITTHLSALTPHSGVMFSVVSVGSNPVRNFEVRAGELDDRGYSPRGDGLVMSRTLNRGESVTVSVFDAEHTAFSGASLGSEIRIAIAPDAGVYVTVQWQSPLRPWRQSSRTYAWPPVRRYSGKEPEVLTGASEVRFLKKTRDDTLNIRSSGYIRPADERVRAKAAEDTNFDELIAAASGTVLVCLASWAAGWDDAKRVIDAFATEYADRVAVLMVDIVDSSDLTARFEVTEIPHFAVLVDGRVVKTQTGVRSFAKLEALVAEHIPRTSRARLRWADRPIRGRSSNSRSSSDTPG